MLADDTVPARAKVAEAERKLEAWQTQVRLSNPEFLNRQNPPVVTAQAARSLAAAFHATIVEFAIRDGRSDVWVVTTEGIELKRLPAGHAQIENGVRALRAALAAMPTAATTCHSLSFCLFGGIGLGLERNCCMSRLRRPLMTKPPRPTVSSKALSAASSGRRARTPWPFQFTALVKSSTSS